MDYALVAIGGIVAIVGAAALAPKLGIAAPLLLVVVGVGYSFIPGVPQIEIEPEWILAGVLPPLLYAAAINVPIVDFRRNFTAIAGLSVLLVIASAFLTGFVLFALLPDLDFAAALALGAVISPTDVVAATSIGKRLGLPPRLLTILEGEGLVNDATALVLLKAALAAVALAAQGIEFNAWTAIWDFGFAVVVAIAIGLAVGIIAVWVRRKLNNPMLDTAISFAVPFIAFLPAEQLGASGVIAVVTVGLYSGHQSARQFSAQSRISERLNWRTVQFVIENGVFLLMGAQISGIIAGVHADDLSVDQAIYYGLLVTGHPDRAAVHLHRAAALLHPAGGAARGRSHVSAGAPAGPRARDDRRRQVRAPQGAAGARRRPTAERLGPAAGGGARLAGRRRARVGRDARRGHARGRAVASDQHARTTSSSCSSRSLSRS